jgi:ParB/RepB/Spo0J family partition protein
MKIDITHISPDPDNVRRIKPSREADEALRISMSTLGQLQPILVRDNPEGGRRYVIVAGERRWRAAQALGWTEIEAIDHAGSGDQIVAAGAAENMVRSSMNPVDQWRAMKTLQDGGMSVALAAQSLGIPETTARRMTLLAGAHPDVLAAIAEHGIPNTHELRRIVAAPRDMQKAAIAHRHSWAGPKGAREPRWHYIARHCEVMRLNKVDALFDPDAFGIVWDEDLFAEPDADDRFTTSDTKKFMACQVQAVKALAAKSKHAVYGEVGPTGLLVAPAGWKMEHTIQFDARKPIRSPGPDRKLLIGVVPEGYGMGRATAAAISEAGAKKKGAPGRAAIQDDPKPVTVKPPIDKKGAILLNEMKRGFFAEAFSDEIRALSDANMIRLLLIALAASNLRITRDGVAWRTENMEDIAERALAWPTNSASVDDLKIMAGEALSRIIQVSDGKGIGSGPAVGWIGSQIFHVEQPRFDTEEFLAHVNADVLALLAEGKEMVPAKTGAKLRAQLVGKLPGWTPPGWFDDRAPIVARPGDDDDGEGDSEADEEAGQQEAAE